MVRKRCRKYAHHMTSVTFDTLRFAKKLQKSGLTEEQAEVFADALKEAVTDELVTKADLQALRHDLDLRFHELDLRFHELDGRFHEIDMRFQDVDKRFQSLIQGLDLRSQSIDARFQGLEGKLIQLEQRMTIKLGSMMMLSVGAVAALVKLL
jgi:hypothetical protein